MIKDHIFLFLQCAYNTSPIHAGKMTRTRELHRQICRRIIIIQCLWFLPIMHKWWLASKRREDIHPGWRGESVFMLKYMETIKLHGSLQRCLASYFCTLMRNPMKQCYIGHTWFHKKYQLSCFAWLLFFLSLYNSPQGLAILIYYIFTASQALSRFTGSRKGMTSQNKPQQEHFMKNVNIAFQHTAGNLQLSINWMSLA